MSRLEYYSRPLVAFDPCNKEHRRYYREFLSYGGWGKCPVRFICPEDSGWDLPTMIRNSLIEYYTSKEFTKADLFKRPKGTVRRRQVIGLTNQGHQVII